MQEKKIVINMLSKADSVDGQGVGSAYIEQVRLVKETSGDLFDVCVNKHKKCDILHVHSINPTFYIRMRMKGKKTKRVMYCHFLPKTLKDSIKLPKPIFSIFCAYVMSFYKHADYLVVVNPIFIEELVKLGVRREQIVYIPNFVSPDQFFKIEDKAVLDETRKKYGIPLEAKVILGAGQVQSRKGVMDFVEVAKKNPDITFVWAGGFSFGQITEGYKELKGVVENPPENVKFLGIVPRTEMNTIFNVATCLFVPSYNELFPMTILEAASSETPIVLRDLDLYKPILPWQRHFHKDNEEFSSAIRKIVEDPEYYKECLEDSLEIKKFYSREHVGNMWREFYTKIVEKKAEKQRKSKI